MSLPLIARDLYRFQQQAVDRLERELADSPPAEARRDEAETRSGEKGKGSNAKDVGRSLGPMIKAEHDRRNLTTDVLHDGG
jgi:hypothetical protein